MISETAASIEVDIARAGTQVKFVHDLTAREQKQHNGEARRRDKAHEDAIMEYSLFNNEARRWEKQLRISRWTPGCFERVQVEKMIEEREYDRAMDRLEGLVVARLFELLKMNLAGTGTHFHSKAALTLTIIHCCKQASSFEPR